MRRKFLLMLIIFFGLCIIFLSLLFFQPYLWHYAAKLRIPAVREKIPTSHVLLMGINGLDWKLVQRFSAEGNLKVLPDLMSSGSYGLVATYTKESEEAIWVTVCTGYLPENPPLYNELIVTDYLKFAAKIKNVEKAKLASEVDLVIEKTSLGDVRDSVIGKLSKGFKQRSP